MFSLSTRSAVDSEVSDVLGDLVRDTLRTLLPVTLGLSWLWLASQIVAATSTSVAPTSCWGSS